MNYRHIYHAGCYADVFKHIILIEILLKLRLKEKPFCVIDTHAGIGLYDLDSIQAQKTGEFEKGISKFLIKGRSDPDFIEYVRVIDSLNQNCREKGAPALKKYPGSPAFARFCLRPQDRLRVCEWHPEDVKILQEHFEKDSQVKVFHQDAYQFLKAVLPPLEKRGLVLIDPPFEKTNEFENLIGGLTQAFKRFAHGIYALWYPIKEIDAIDQFHFDLKKAGFGNFLCIEMALDILPPEESLRGCGMIIFNPPWQLDERMKIILPKLMDYLEFKGSSRIENIN
ncbi:MAG: 23S rRNA (adenine(2030)-N(6))-methyltransferase RlmJ [Janthinobacterium lividum]